MKHLLLSILILLFIPSLVYAGEYQYPKLNLELNKNLIILKQKDKTFTHPSLKENEYAGIKKVLQEDLNGDGKREYILAVQLEGIKCVNDDGSIDDLPKFPYAIVLIAEQRENELDIQKQMVLGCGFPDFELADVNKDGIKDVIASGWEPKNWSHLKIASWQKDKYTFLWSRGEFDSIVKQIFGEDDNGIAQIKVGFPHPEGGHGYAPELWEIWVWNGKKFILKETKQKVSEREGNIYLMDDDGNEIQLTSSGKDSWSTISPDREQIIFVRQLKEYKDNPYGIPETEAELAYMAWSPYEIWTVDIDERKPKVLRKSSYESQDAKGKTGWFYDLNFSPDGKKVYYACQPACPTTHAIHSMNYDGTEDRWICWGESVDAVGGSIFDKYYGHLVVSRKADDGAYDVYVVMTPNGKEVEFLGISDQDFWKNHQKVD